MLSRYVRQLMLPEIGDAGQARLLAGKVLIVGCGALGCMQAQALTRAGVGFIRLADRDGVDLTNLHRQILYSELDAASGVRKAEIAATKLAEINGQVRIDAHSVEVTAENIRALADGVDLVLDATDNFATRAVINEECVRRAIPWVYGGVFRTEGLVMSVYPSFGPCLRCVFPHMAIPTTTKEIPQGIFPTAPAIIGGLQATLALRMLLDAPDFAKDDLAGKLYRFDFWRMRMSEVAVAKRAACPSCGTGVSECSPASSAGGSAPLH